MKRALLIFACAVAGYAQSFPTSIYTPLKAVDNLQTTLSTAMLIGDTTAFVASTTGWVANSTAYICDTSTATRCTGTFEVMLVTAVPSANALTVTRGYGGTTARAHASGKTVSNSVVSVYNTTLNNEVLAIETALGTNLSNVTASPFYNTATYKFAAQSPTTPASLIIGANTVIMAPVPPGVNGTDTGHYLYVAGTGTPELCLISGGSGTAGQTSGQIILTCAGTHSAGYTVQSSAVGVPEAIVAACAGGGGAIRIPTVGTVSLYGGWTVPAACGISLRGAGMGQTYLQMVASTVGSPGTTGNWFTWNTGSGTGAAIDFGDMSINDITGVDHTAGSLVKILNRIEGSVSNLELKNGYVDIECNNCAANLNFRNVHAFAKHFALQYLGTQTQVSISDSTISGGVSAIDVNNTQVPGFYMVNNLLDNTASGGTTSSSCIRFTEVGSNVINEVVFTGNDCESVGDGLEYNGVSTAYAGQNSVNITGNRFNVGTYAIYAAGQVNGLHIESNYMALSGASAAALVYASDVTNLAVQNNRFYGQNTAAYFVQGAGTISANWIITGNSLESNNTATFTNMVAMPSGMSNVLISDNVWPTITTPVTNVAGTNVRVRGYTGTVASAASITAPPTDNFTISGATGITMFAVNQGIARFGFITATSGVTFTAGVTIGNTAALPAGVPTPYYWDGTQIFLNPSVPYLYNAAGTLQTLPHRVVGKCTLGTSCVVTLAGSAAYTSTSTYQCTATDQTAAAAVKVVNTAAGTVTFTGTGTDVISYLCDGN